MKETKNEKKNMLMIDYQFPIMCKQKSKNMNNGN